MLHGTNSYLLLSVLVGKGGEMIKALQVLYNNLQVHNMIMMYSYLLPNQHVHVLCLLNHL